MQFEIEQYNNYIDIFLSCEWPSNVCNLVSFDKKIDNESNYIKNMVNDMNPRYHFASSSSFFY